MMQQPILKTKRLLLRPYLLSDAKDVQMLAGDEKIAETTLNIPHPYLDGMAESWIESIQRPFEEKQFFSFAIIRHEDEKLIGTIAIHVNSKHRKAELAYWVGVPYWGKGYCTEATQCIVTFGFENLDLNKLFALVIHDNVASYRVMEKVGMTYEGLRREELIKDGIGIDLKSYAILKKDYIEMKPRSIYE